MIVDGWAQGNARTTLDDLFRRAAVANPDGVALADADRQLTYAEADRVIWAIAAQLRALGLATDAVIGVQLSNAIESPLALLAVLRAGMIAALLPMLWRESEIVAALSGAGAKALVMTRRLGGADRALLAQRVAAGLFSIRHVCAFGDHLPDGVVALDEAFHARTSTPSPISREGNPATHAAVVTFEPTPRGIQPVVRNHIQLIAGGHAVASAGELNSSNTLLSAMPLTSLAALAGIFVPWLFSGGRLVLHQPFDVDVFVSQAEGADVIALPGALAPAFAPTKRTIIAHWRAPERIDPQPLAGNAVDVISYGEFGLHVAKRDEHGRVAPPVLGTNYLPGHCPDRPNVLEAKRTTAGTFALRGSAVAKTGFGVTDQGAFHASDGFIETGYHCRIGSDGSVVITGPQPGMVSTGGYRIARHDLDQVAVMTPFGIVSVLPHALLGQRLAGSSPEQSEVAGELEARGLNALIVEAFGRRAA